MPAIAKTTVVQKSRAFALLALLFAIAIYSCRSSRHINVDHERTAAIINYTNDSLPSIDFSKKLDAAKAQNDILILKQALEEAQTSLHSYSSKAEIDKAFSEALEQVKASPGYLDMVGAIAKIQHTIACGHSSWEHAAGYKQYRDSAVRILPMDIAIVNGRYYVRKNYSLQSAIPNFAEITHINGIPVKKLTARLKPYMNQDGNANPGNTLEMEQYFKMAYSNFIDNPGAFVIKTRDKKNYIVQPMPVAQIDSMQKVRYGKERGKPLQFSIHDRANAGVYTIGRFSNEVIRRYGQEFVPFTDSVFAVLNGQNINKLVIDLRGNRGGWTANGVHLFSYFIDKPVPYIKRVETRKYTAFSFEPLVTDHAGYNDTMILAHNGRNYEWKNNPNLMAYPSEKNRFKGDVYILVDGFTRSASAVFCALMKEHTNAVIVGEELTAAHCGTSGMVMSIRLPYTGIPVSFSTARYSFAISDSTDTRGIRPDIKVLPSLEYVQGKRDVYMERALGHSIK